MSSSNPVPQVLGKYLEEEEERLQDPEGVEHITETVPFRRKRTGTHMNSKRMQQHKEDPHMSKLYGFPVLRGES